jgi:hypothetical protein
MITILVHLAGREAIKIDVEDMPTLIFPWHQITFLEVLPSSEEQEAFPLPFRND